VFRDEPALSLRLAAVPNRHDVADLLKVRCYLSPTTRTTP
ncbi:hypothetical protein LCGC14_2460480, partial [marine sediment metagenome]